jgi:pimeloyl-ACP methyl ester carboxylesterase
MKLLVITAVVTGLVGAAVPGSGAAAPVMSPASTPVSSIAWSPCPDYDPILRNQLKGLECGSLQVPLDHSRPDGQKITLALTRAKHTAPDSQYQGIVLLNRGHWPVPFGRDLPTRFAKGSSGLPTEVGSTYDWIGFDPRGVGASEPIVTCGPTHLDLGSARPDYVPRTDAEEQAWQSGARAFAESCGQKYGEVLKHLNTKDTVRDMDLIREALGQEKINYFGYSYGTYLGSVYASMFPHRVRRMVLDSVVRPSGVWYENGLEQNVAFENSAKIFFAWIAKYDSVYQLGKTQAEVEANYYKGMALVREAPIDGVVGPAEYTDIFIGAVYRNYVWIEVAQVLADWVLRNDPAGLKENYRRATDFPWQTSYAIDISIQCRDASWPRNWTRWHQDHSRQYSQGNRFRTWYNAWYNAPCAFWPVPADKPQKVGHRDVDILLMQAENDAATPVGGAYEAHAQFPNSRFVLERGGTFHGTSLTANANACMNSYVIAYLKDGARPISRKGVDAYCEANPAPDPTASAS